MNEKLLRLCDTRQSWDVKRFSHKCHKYYYFQEYDVRLYDWSKPLGVETSRRRLRNCNWFPLVPQDDNEYVINTIKSSFRFCSNCLYLVRCTSIRFASVGYRINNAFSGVFRSLMVRRQFLLRRVCFVALQTNELGLAMTTAHMLLEVATVQEGFAAKFTNEATLFRPTYAVSGFRSSSAARRVLVGAFLLFG